MTPTGTRSRSVGSRIDGTVSEGNGKPSGNQRLRQDAELVRETDAEVVSAQRDAHDLPERVALQTRGRGEVVRFHELRGGAPCGPPVLFGRPHDGRLGDVQFLCGHPPRCLPEGDADGKGEEEAVSVHRAPALANILLGE